MGTHGTHLHEKMRVKRSETLHSSHLLVRESVHSISCVMGSRSRIALSLAQDGCRIRRLSEGANCLLDFFICLRFHERRGQGWWGREDVRRVLSTVVLLHLVPFFPGSWFFSL